LYTEIFDEVRDMEPILRMATIDDIEDLVRVRFDYFEAEKWDITAEKRSIIKTSLLQYYKRHINDDFFAALIEIENQIASVAFLAITEKPANLSWPTGRIGTILNVLTYPEHRKMGYATKTLNFLIEESKRQNLSYLELSSSGLGKTLYKKLGFQDILESDVFLVIPCKLF